METDRLILRQWNKDDYQAYAELTSDSQVMRYFPSTLSTFESNDQADKIKNIISENGWGFWAVELKSTNQFIGFVGLHYQDKNNSIPNTPFIEIGWRLSAKYWRSGYASEAAKKALEFAFETLDVHSVYAFTALKNLPSQKVMMKIGMENIKHDFNHPRVKQEHELSRHCLFKITKLQWLNQ